MAPATKTTLHSLQDRILIKRIDKTEIRRGGLVIPDSAKEKPQEDRFSRSARAR